MNNQNIEKNSIIKKDEVNLIDLAKTIWDGRKTIVKSTIIFMAIGLFVAVFSEPEYTAYTTMVPQTEDSSSKLSGNLGGLAAMAGINLGNLGTELSIPPNLYPKVVSSIPFQKELMQTHITISGHSGDLTLLNYYNEVYKPGVLGYLKKYTVGLPGVIFDAIRGKAASVENMPEENLSSNDFLQISTVEKELIQRLRKQLFIEVNDKDGHVTITSVMPEAKAAAQLANRASNLLQQAITDFKIQKAKEKLSFVEEQYGEKKKKFEELQERLAMFRDRNRDVSTAIAQTELQRLQSEYSLVYNVYSELAKQLETQKMQVKENTPIFTIIEPVTIPYQKSAPKRLVIFIVWVLLGGVVGIGWVFGREFLFSVKDRWSRES